MLDIKSFTTEKKYIFTGDELPRSIKNKSIEETEYIEKQKHIRKQVQLPVTKSLVYFKHPYINGSKPYRVISYDAKQFVADDGYVSDWYDVTLQVAGIENDIRIHGDFFSEMQKPNFIEHFNKEADKDE